MTETPAAASVRHLAEDLPWPWRAPLMALICACAGLLVWALVHDLDTLEARLPAAAAVAVTVATIGFVLTVELRRWLWALLFALGWGVAIGLIAYMASGYGHVRTLFEWPFFSSLLAVLLAAPLFQAARDTGEWRVQPPAVVRHLWVDAVIGATALLFVGLTFAMTALIAGLFDMIGLSFLKRLFGEGWFAWMLAGAAFGGALGVLRERDALVDTMLRLVFIVMSVLAPVLAVALLLFLLSLPVAGLGGLWDGWISAAALTLAAGGGALVFANAAIGSGSERQGGGVRLFDWSARLLIACILPLAALAALAMGLRIGQYGWTPERIWGVLAAGVALAIGAAGWWVLARRWHDFSASFQRVQVGVAAGVCALALFLALPIIDFGAISTRDQLARLNSGAVSAQDFDWAALAFDFGPSGRAALQRIARSGSPEQRSLASAALASDTRYNADQSVQTAGTAAGLDNRVERTGVRVPLDGALREAIANTGYCDDGPCVLHGFSARQVLVHDRAGQQNLRRATVLTLMSDGRWQSDWMNPDEESPASPSGAANGITVEPVTRRELRINGVSWGLLPEPR